MKKTKMLTLLSFICLIFLSSCGGDKPDIEFNSEQEVIAHMDSLFHELQALTGSSKKIKEENRADSVASLFAKMTCDCISNADLDFFDRNGEDLLNVFMENYAPDNVYGASFELFYQCKEMVKTAQRRAAQINRNGFYGPAQTIAFQYIEMYCPEEAIRVTELWKRHSLAFDLMLLSLN